MVEKRPACWIRGNMSPSDYEDDEIRRITHECPHRKPTGWSLFGATNECYHPGAVSEHTDEQGNTEYVMLGGVDGYATFCQAVDSHLTSLGEPSRLYIDAEYTVLDATPIVDEQKLLTMSNDEETK